MEALLQIEHLKKYFNTPAGMVHAVDDVSFTIGRGRTLGVVGESGCGKTTLGRTVLRLTPATSGRVLFEGRDILQYNRAQLKQLRREMQIIFQDPYASLDPRMTVSSIIAEPLRVSGVCRSKRELDSRVSEIMEVVGIAQRIAGAYPHELDGGRRQRVGIARALALNPKFVVCDEPVSALDVSIQAQILNLLMDIQQERGLSYMFVTHDLSVVKHISNDIAVMYLGHLVEKSSSDELFAHPLHPYTQALLAAIPIPELGAREKKRVPVRGEVTSPIDPKPGCRFAARCEYATQACFDETPALREVSPEHFVACRRVQAGPESKQINQ